MIVIKKQHLTDDLFSPEAIEREYVTGSATYTELAQKYNVSRKSLADYARKNNWVGKRISYQNSPDTPIGNGLERLTRSSEALEELISSAFVSAPKDPTFSDIDTKTLKELTAVLKEAINIKQSLLLLPVLTEQKQLELTKTKTPASAASESEIRVFLENGADRFCV